MTRRRQAARSSRRAEASVLDVGIYCSGVGASATSDFVRRSAVAAEAAGFATLWFGDHVLLFSSYSRSTYPYAGLVGGKVPIRDPRVAFLDPVVAMTWSAAATSRIKVGTSILILPQRNPVVAAKQLATLDALSDGRVRLGIGVGWCREEYESVSDDWAFRGKRMAEHLAIMRTLWEGDECAYSDGTTSFAGAFSFPKPASAGGIPVLIGGESDVALNRVAQLGDGWIAFRLPPEHAAERVSLLKRMTENQGRDPEQLRIVVAIFPATTLADLGTYRKAGVTEFYLSVAGTLPLEDSQLRSDMTELSRRFVEVVSDW